ncbi:MAG: acyloxyacyl hydrolase [Kiritimatiellaceae bacterium]|nr:acyloxyacyl hydrolase [Kiritimatiellaceae bacterium]
MRIIAAILLLTLTTASASTEETLPPPYNQIFLGGGTSIKGFGDTEQEISTVDILWRHGRVFFEKDTGWIRGRHEFWMETPLSIILEDSDNQDANDIGIIGLNFLFAWIFPETTIGEPYFLIGGGPQYIMADIDGVSSDICGNYQAGIGTRFLVTEKHPVNLEIRYHHISNLGMKYPNVPINSVKFFIGATLPF